MSHYCMFDQLPVELLHTVFTYFSARELLSIFYNVSDYVNDILQSYPFYQLDFKSILKSDFRRVCRHVRPEQVISLTLSDSNDTPGQSELFFSRFRIEQFVRLRSLKLIEIEFDSLISIFSNLPKLHELRSFSFDAHSVRHIYGRMDNKIDLNCSNQHEPINSRLHHTYAKVFSQLNFLDLNGGWVLETIPVPNLIGLKLARCPVDKLERITQLMPQLKSLDICVTSGRMYSEAILLPSRLTRLNLKIQDFSVSMNSMECLLSNRSHLKYLELQIRGCDDLIDGHRWQILTGSLITFNFKVNLYLCTFTDKIFDSFRTSFWLEEKHWFVAYEGKCLFSVPYFAPEQIYTSNQPPIHCTAPDNTVFYQNVTKLDVVETQTFSRRFTHINMVELKHTISQTKLFRFVDSHHVKHLSILSLNNLLQFPALKRRMSSLCRLSVKNNITIEETKQMINNCYEQIRTLEIKTSYENQNDIVEELLRLFPCTEQLIHKSIIQNIEVMVRFIDGFKHLLNASFFLCGPLWKHHPNLIYDSDLLILRTNRLIYGLTMCRIYNLPENTSIYSIDWWIEN